MWIKIVNHDKSKPLCSTYTSRSMTLRFGVCLLYPSNSKVRTWALIWKVRIGIVCTSHLTALILSFRAKSVVINDKTFHENEHYLTFMYLLEHSLTYYLMGKKLYRSLSFRLQPEYFYSVDCWGVNGTLESIKAASKSACANRLFLSYNLHCNATITL
jgi:hypothetical protein